MPNTEAPAGGGHSESSSAQVDPATKVRLTCHGLQWGAEDLEALVSEAQTGSLGTLPNGWTVLEAVRRPLTPAELAPILAILADIQARERFPDELIQERVARLAVWIMENAPWSPATRTAVAWCICVLGMDQHGFWFRWLDVGRTHGMARPNEAFFLQYGRIEAFPALAGALRDTFYSHSGERF